jgi:CheY-like chemotaxis protein
MSPLPQNAGRTVLIVEDDQDNRQVVAEILERHGFTALSAADPAEALLTCRVHDGDIDLLVTDVALPGVSGGNVARSVVALRPETRVLYMTAMPRDIAIRRAELTPDAVLLGKPFSTGQLIESIGVVLGEASPDHR